VFIYHSIVELDLGTRPPDIQFFTAYQWNRKITMKTHNYFPLKEDGNELIKVINVMKRSFFEDLWTI
jgi:hypothetical protein